MDGLCAGDLACHDTNLHGDHLFPRDYADGTGATQAREANIESLAIGEHIERACENCHSQYWYPNEKIPDLVITHESDTNVSTPPATAAKN